MIQKIDFAKAASAWTVLMNTGKPVELIPAQPGTMILLLATPYFTRIYLN